MRLKNKKRFAGYTVSILIIIAGVMISNEKSNNDNMQINTNDSQNISSKEQYQNDISIVENIVENPLPQQPVEPLKKYYDIPLSYELQDFIREMCMKYDVDMENILSIIHTESEFKHDVQSKNQGENGMSIGLTQLNINYINWYKELTGNNNFNIYDVKNNIEGGVAVFKFYKIYWINQGISGDELFIASLNSYNMGIDKYKAYIRNTGMISRSYDRKTIDYKNNELKITK